MTKSIIKYLTGILSVLLITLPFGTILKAQEMAVFERSELGIKLSYPKEIFTPVPSTTAQVLLMLKCIGDDASSFNIIRSVGSVDTSPANSVKNKASILESYHSVGLTDAKVFEDGTVEIGSKLAFFASLEYTFRGVKMASIVHLIPLKSELALVLTFTAPKDRFLQSKKLSERLLSGFSFIEKAKLK